MIEPEPGPTSGLFKAKRSLGQLFAKRTPRPTGLNRRGFLGTVLGSVFTLLARPFAARAQATPAATASSPGATPTPVPPDPKAQALAKLAKERYGKFLSDEELAMLDERIAGVERRSARLRAVKLANGDEPAILFRAGPA